MQPARGERARLSRLGRETRGCFGMAPFSGPFVERSCHRVIRTGPNHPPLHLRIVCFCQRKQRVHIVLGRRWLE